MHVVVKVFESLDFLFFCFQWHFGVVVPVLGGYVVGTVVFARSSWGFGEVVFGGKELGGWGGLGCECVWLRVVESIFKFKVKIS